MLRLKYDYKLLQSICNEGNVKLIDDYKDKYITRDTRIIGKCIMCENTFDKSLNNLHKNQNFGCITCAKIIKTKKISNTMLHKYGVEHAVHSEIFKNKMKETSLEKYGVEYAIQNETIKSKIRKTNLDKYGVEYGLQCESVKDKKIVTYLKNYGVENPLQSQIVKDKCKETNLKRYGFEYSSQNSEVMERMIKGMYKSKQYIMPSENIISIQGYENYALDELLNLEQICENDIITGCTNVPTIWYNDENGKKRRHYVDIFIPSQNRCIEVKSTWTAKLNNHTIFLKQKAAKELGYKYEIWVYDNNKTKVELFI